LRETRDPFLIQVVAGLARLCAYTYTVKEADGVEQQKVVTGALAAKAIFSAHAPSHPHTYTPAHPHECSNAHPHTHIVKSHSLVRYLRHNYLKKKCYGQF
jgi:hypothetical protein